MTSGSRRRSTRATLTLHAHAKINLDLRVSDPAADGMHDVTTVLQSIALHDTLRLRPSGGGFTIRCATEGVPLDERNLIWVGARALWRRLGRRGDPNGVDLVLFKRIAMQAGLGGGTADAVTALLGLCQLWEVAPKAALLQEVASEVGADGPFFLVGGTALGIGRGDQVYPLDELARRWVVLLLPTRGVSTAAAYGWLDRDRAARRRGPGPRRPPVAGGALDLGAMTNELQAPVVRRRPEIRRAIGLVRDAGAEMAAMTGSGSAVYGLFRARRAAAVAVAHARASGWRALLTTTLSRRQRTGTWQRAS